MKLKWNQTITIQVEVALNHFRSAVTRGIEAIDQTDLCIANIRCVFILSKN